MLVQGQHYLPLRRPALSLCLNNARNPLYINTLYFTDLKPMDLPKIFSFPDRLSLMDSIGVLIENYYLEKWLHSPI